TCQNTPVDCSAGDSDCTVGVCNPENGQCQKEPTNEGGSCDDGDACTDPDTCTQGSCGGSPVDCNDNNVCTADSCDSETGCENKDISDTCDDSIDCTVDSCDPVSGCQNDPDDLFCDDDDNLCSTGFCSANEPGTGCQFIVVGCIADSFECTEEQGCNPETGQCEVIFNDEACDDQDDCTADSCTEEGCVNEPIPDCEECPEIEPGDFCGYTQGGWGQDKARGGNVASIRDAHFFDIYGADGFRVGGTNNVTYGTSAHVAEALPQGGKPRALDMDYASPFPKKPVTVLWGQLTALQLNCDYSAAGVLDQALAIPLCDLIIVEGPFAGMTVGTFLAEAMGVLGGDIEGDASLYNATATAINENFDGCSGNNGFVTRFDEAQQICIGQDSLQGGTVDGEADGADGEDAAFTDGPASNIAGESNTSQATFGCTLIRP
ncbi:MAG: hypothetical protein R3330_14000, partial [Saprospiraceae bacterium]|nr:hypothetical protein [Saprospiraceae bacterium]